MGWRTSSSFRHGTVVAALLLAGCSTENLTNRPKTTEIVTDPPGARIEINDQFVGIAPINYPFQQDSSGNVLGTYRMLASPVAPNRMAESMWLGGKMPVPSKLILENKRPPFVPPPVDSLVASPPQADAASKQAKEGDGSEGINGLLVGSGSQPAAYPVRSGHWISAVMDGGKLIKLEDGSLWKVSPIDSINSALWLPATSVTVIDSEDPAYPFKLISMDDNETVDARLIAIH